jgi:hypothetical protein
MSPSKKMPNLPARHRETIRREPRHHGRAAAEQQDRVCRVAGRGRGAAYRVISRRAPGSVLAALTAPRRTAEGVRGVGPHRRLNVMGCDVDSFHRRALLNCRIIHVLLTVFPFCFS